MFSDGYDRLVDLDRSIKEYKDKIRAVYRSSAACRSLGTIPRVGPIIATAMVAALGDGNAFANGRQVAVANKNARTIWALLIRDEVYRAPLSQAA